MGRVSARAVEVFGVHAAQEKCRGVLGVEQHYARPPHPAWHCKDSSTTLRCHVEIIGKILTELFYISLWQSPQSRYLHLVYIEGFEKN